MCYLAYCYCSDSNPSISFADCGTVQVQMLLFPYFIFSALISLQENSFSLFQFSSGEYPRHLMMKPETAILFVCFGKYTLDAWNTRTQAEASCTGSRGRPVTKL
jgi:hypothetical protein